MLTVFHVIVAIYHMERGVPNSHEVLFVWRIDHTSCDLIAIWKNSKLVYDDFPRHLKIVAVVDKLSLFKVRLFIRSLEMLFV